MDYWNLFIALFGSTVALATIMGPLLIGKLFVNDIKYLAQILCVNLFYLLSVGTEAYFVGKPGHMVFLILNISNFLQYFFLYFLANIVTIYLGYRMKEKGLTCPAVRPFMIFYFISYLLLIFNLYNKMYYYIDGNNLYHRGDYHLISQLIGLILYGFVVYLIVKYHNSLSGFDFLIIHPYLIFFPGAIIIQLIYGKINVIALSITLSSVILIMKIMYHWSHFYSSEIKELEQLRLTVKFGKIAPQFVNNVLSDISQLCIEDYKRASKIMDCFSEFLRKSMNDNEKAEIVSFREEYEHLNNYLILEQMRFDDLYVEYELEEMDFQLPNQVLQQLAECMIHFIMLTSEDSFHMYIHTYCENGRYQIELYDKNDSYGGSRKQKLQELQIMEDIRKRLHMISDSILTYEYSKQYGNRYCINLGKGGNA